MARFYTILKTFLPGFISLIFLISIGYTQNEPIKIGFVGDFSDVTQVYCRSSYKAARMAVAE